MTDVELEALTAAVNAERALIEQQVRRYDGELQRAPDYRLFNALEIELQRRGVLPAPGEKHLPPITEPPF